MVRVEIRCHSGRSAQRVALDLIERGITFEWCYSGGLVASYFHIDNPCEEAMKHLSYTYKIKTIRSPGRGDS